MVNCKMQMAFVGSSSSSSLSSLKKLHLHFQLYERHRLFVSSLNWKGRHNSLACSYQKRLPRASLKNLNMSSVDSITPTTKTGIAPSQSPDLIKPTNIVWHECSVNKEERQKLLRQKGCVIWITGLSGSGKSTLACALSRQLHSKGKLTYVLDGDNVRHGLNKNLSFSAEDRAENIRRIGEAAKLFADAGVICIASVISPYRRDRNECRSLLRPGEFIEIYMDFSLDICENRDPKGLYKLARTGKIKGFTGIDDPYEAPETCEIVMRPINGKCPAPKEMAEQACQYLETNGFFRA